MWLRYIFIGGLVFAGIAGSALAQSAQDAYLHLYDISLKDASTAHKAHDLEMYYATAIVPLQSVANSRISNADADFLFRSANLMNFYTDEPKYIPAMEQDLRLLHKTGTSSEENDRDLFGALMEAREFDQARRWVKEHPLKGIEDIPTMHGPRAQPPAILVPSADQRSLTSRHVDLHAAQIIVVGHPLCHFTQHAVDFIDSKPALKRAFAEHSMWVTPPARQLDLPFLSAWNKRHPAERMVLSQDLDGWPSFDSWDTPTFYFVKDGRVVEEVVGWPKAGNEKAVRQGLEKLGLVQ